jgi:predicted kinase
MPPFVMMLLMNDMERPRLVLFCGLPGSGKTTLAKQLEAQGKGIRICTDEWQADLKVDSTALYDNFHERLQRRLYKLSLQLLQNSHNVILEDGLWMKEERTEKLADAKKCGAIVTIHYFDLSFEEIWKRLHTRNHSLPHGAIEMTKSDLQKCWDIFQKPTPNELSSFDEVFIHTDSMTAIESARTE